MKRNILYMIGLLGLLQGMSSCDQHDAELYENDPRVYFYRGSYEGGNTLQQDSIKHSFFLLPMGQDRDTVWVDVRTMGMPVEDKARPVKIVQTNAGQPDGAVVGTHYVAFDDPAIAEMMAVQPGQVQVMIPVILLRDPSLKTRKVRIEMEVAGNEYFNPGIDKARKFMIQTTTMAEMPASWSSSWTYYFGKWGTQKMWFVVNYLGFSEFDQVPDAGYRDYLKLKARQELMKYNQEHAQPLCENGDKIHEPGETCVDCVVFP